MNNFLFGVYPYIAISVMIMVSIARYERDPFSWKSKSSQLLRKKQFVIGSVLFHLGVLVILGGHFVGLLTPHWVYAPFISSGHKQMVAIVVGGIFGVMCLIGMTILLLRRLFHARVRATGSGRDLLILVLLYAQLLLGLSSITQSFHHLDGSQMVKLGEWAQHIVTFRPGAAAYVADAHWIFKAHITLGLTIILITPFTRLVHVWSVPVGYLVRPYQVVRKRQASIRYPR